MKISLNWKPLAAFHVILQAILAKLSKASTGPADPVVNRVIQMCLKGFCQSQGIRAVSNSTWPSQA